MKLKKSEVDWARVEKLALQSFRGRGLSHEETAYITAAYKADPQRYGEVTERRKNEEIDAIRSGKAVP